MGAVLCINVILVLAYAIYIAFWIEDSMGFFVGLIQGIWISGFGWLCYAIAHFAVKYW